MDIQDIISQRCEQILTTPLKNAIVLGLKDAYETTYQIAADFPPELQSRVFGNHLWAESQKQLLDVAGAFTASVRARFERVDSNGFPYLTWTCSSELLLTVKRALFKNELANKSDYRKNYASNIQPSLFDETETLRQEEQKESLYGVILHGIDPSAMIRTEPSFVTIAFPNIGFTQYIASLDLLGSFDISSIEPTVEPELKEEVQEWLARPKKRKLGA